MNYEHKCEICGKHWRSEEKTDVCPLCDHWHISYIEDLSPEDPFIQKQHEAVGHI